MRRVAAAMILASALAPAAAFLAPRSLARARVGSRLAAAEEVTLVEEVEAMMDLSLLIYPLASLRQLASDPEAAKALDVDPPTIGIPATVEDVLGAVEQYLEALIQSAEASKDKAEELSAAAAAGDEPFDEKDLETVFQTEDEVKDTIMQLSALKTIEDRHRQAGYMAAHSTATLQRFNDDFNFQVAEDTEDAEKARRIREKLEDRIKAFRDSKLVYAITDSVAPARTSVIFRGSVTKRDWFEDIRVFQEDVAGPGTADMVGLHRGFQSYLFDSGKYEQIIADLQGMYEKDPDSKLYITGHSLGGALCTLFGAYAAADDRIPESAKPVTVVSFASPRVGDDRFLDAFQNLEEAGKLRHIRVCNAGDAVTLAPMLDYYHAGVQVYQKESGGVIVDHVEEDDGPLQEFRRKLRNSWMNNLDTPKDYYYTHGLREYSKRFMEAKEGGAFEGKTMADVYSDEDV